MSTDPSDVPQRYRVPLACFILGTLLVCVCSTIAIVASIFVGKDALDLAVYTGEKILQAAGVSIQPDPPSSFMTFVVVTSAALASFGAFLVVASMIWSTVIYGPHNRVSRVWKARRDARASTAPALPGGPSSTIALEQGAVATADTLTAMSSDVPPPETWKG